MIQDPPTIFKNIAGNSAHTVNALIAIIKIAQEIPDCISHDCHDEIGRFLYPLVQAIATENHLTGNAILSEWHEQVQKASGNGLHTLHDWLGSNLSQMTEKTLPLYGDILRRLESWQNPAVEQTFTIKYLCRVYSLDQLESRILALAVAFDLSPFGWDYLEVERPAYKMYRAIAAAVGAAIPEVQQALKNNGRLAKLGIMNVGEQPSRGIKEVMGLSRFGKRLFARDISTEGDLLEAASKPFAIDDAPSPMNWSALQTEQRLAQVILETGLQTKKSGINILLYGPPGSGKTAFARHIVQAAGCKAYEVPVNDEEKIPLSNIDRLKSLDLVQRVLGTKGAAAMIIDEAAEIIFNGVIDDFMMDNPNPVIWVCNPVADIDPIRLRRFTLCIHFDTPDVSVRRKIAQQCLAPAGVSEALIYSVAMKEFHPRLLSASARVADLAQGNAGSHDEVVMCYLNNHAKAMDQPSVKSLPQMTTRFDVSYLQVQGRFSAEQIMDAIVRNGTGTLLMGGPPGTGKTQLAKKIAERLGREMIYQTASDINSKWYGESERKVAHMFEHCNPKEQILFLDEAETLLCARESAEHRASEAVTAEFLRQLESFTGVFLCATNHAARFDGALIRRFTFRLEFNPLNYQQREKMLRELAAIPGAETLPLASRQALERLDGLTPGDFANVQRRFTLLNHVSTLDDWLLELQQEWRAKPDKRSTIPIGFV